MHPGTRDVRVVRTFYWNKEPQKVGQRLTLPAAFAMEMQAAGKAEIITAPVIAEKPNTADKSSKSDESASKSKGGSDAR